MKILYVGGQKSGKSRLSAAKTLSIATNKPYYVATYDNSYNDHSMQQRIDNHIAEREEDFITIEEPKDLNKVIQSEQTYLIDCISMWIFNNLNESEAYLKKQLQEICAMDANIVFVLNDVSCGVIPFESESRRFVDFSGLMGQELVKLCDEVYEARYGLEIKLK